MNEDLAEELNKRLENMDLDDVPEPEDTVVLYRDKKEKVFLKSEDWPEEIKVVRACIEDEPYISWTGEDLLFGLENAAAHYQFVKFSRYNQMKFQLVHGEIFENVSVPEKIKQ